VGPTKADEILPKYAQKRRERLSKMPKTPEESTDKLEKRPTWVKED